MRTRLALAAASATLALVAAGCGGSDDADSDPTAAWASGFCTAVTTWTDELQTISSSFSDTANLSEDGVRSAAEDVKTATDQLVDDLRDLGAPETEGGEEIETALEGLSTTLEAEATSIEEAVADVSGLTEIPGAAATITSSLSTMASAFQDALETVEDADAGDELSTALEDSPECDDITG